MILAPVVILLAMSFIFTAWIVFLNHTDFFWNVFNDRQNIINEEKIDEKKWIYNRNANNDIDYVNNQITRDNVFSFDIVSTWYAKYEIVFNDYNSIIWDKQIYVYIMKKEERDSLLDVVKTFNLINLWSIINLDWIKYNWLYKITPNLSEKISIKWNNMNHYLQFIVYNTKNKWIVWELQKIEWDDTKILNIQRQVTEINRQEFENYYQWDWLNW